MYCIYIHTIHINISKYFAHIFMKLCEKKIIISLWQKLHDNDNYFYWGVWLNSPNQILFSAQEDKMAGFGCFSSSLKSLTSARAEPLQLSVADK